MEAALNISLGGGFSGEHQGKVGGGSAVWEDSSLLGWDQFYLINCYRNIYPGHSSSSSHDVFMCTECVRTHWASGGGRGQAGG